MYPPSAAAGTDLILHFDGSFADSGPYNFAASVHGAAAITASPTEFAQRRQ